MKIFLVWIGKTGNESLRKLVSHYQDRLSHYVRLSLIECPTLKDHSRYSQSERQNLEYTLWNAKLPENAQVWLLDEHGKQHSSMVFSGMLQKHSVSSALPLAFVVGGPFGHGTLAKERAHSLLSLSLMTMNHDLVRVVFLEQLYRAFTIINNHPYHNE